MIRLIRLIRLIDEIGSGLVLDSLSSFGSFCVCIGVCIGVCKFRVRLVDRIESVKGRMVIENVSL